MIRFSFFLIIYYLHCLSLAGQETSQAMLDSFLVLGDTAYARSNQVENTDSMFYFTKRARYFYLKAKEREKETLMVMGLAGVMLWEEKVLKAELFMDSAFMLVNQYDLQDRPVVDYLYNTAAVIQQRKGDYLTSNKLLSACVDRQIARVDSKDYDDLLLAVSYQNLGQNAHLCGDYHQSIKYLKQALDIWTPHAESNPSEIAGLQLSIGVAYDKMGELELAANWIRSGRQTLELENNEDKIIAKKIELDYNLGRVLGNMKRYEEAIIQLGKALKLLTEKHQHYEAFTLEEIGLILMKMGDHQKAKPYFEKTLDLLKKQYAHLPQHPNISLAYLNLAKLYHQQKNYVQSLKYLQFANINNGKDYKPQSFYEHPGLNQVITPLVGLQLLQFKAEVLADFSRQGQDLQKMEAALASYQLTSDLIQQNRRYFEAEASKRQISKDVLGIYEKAILLALNMYQIQANPKYIEQAFQFAEANKAAILSEKLQNLVAIGQSGLPDSISAQEQELSIRINYLKEQILQAKEDEMEASEIKPWEDQLFAAEEELSQFSRQLEEEYPAYHQAKYSLHKTDLRSIRSNLLKDNTGLIEYFVGQEKAFLFLLTEADIMAMEISDWEKIPGMVNAIRELVHQGPNSQNYTENVAQFSQLAVTLYEKLLSPVFDHTTSQGLSSLVVIPDDVISYLPFELLLKSPLEKLGSFSTRQLRYLIQDYSISYAYSTQLLLNQPTSTQQYTSSTPLLAYAPSFGTAIAEARASCTSDELYSLQCSRGEVEEISRIWSGEALTGSDATLASFIEQAAPARILHLATHACVDENNSERNKIFFSDQALTGIDLQAMKLHPELTILSACNTGTGQLARGEGILSLARDFRLAGSPSTLTSLWSVDDCATSKIMTSFHRHLFQGKSKAEAIRAAKLDFLATADKEQSHPYFWAAFVQYGDISPLRNPGLPSWLIYSALALIVLALLYGFSKRRKKQALVP